MANLVSRKTTYIVGSEKAEKSDMVEYIIYYIFGILELLLVFRFVFKLAGANPGSGFVSFIYSVSQLFISPFLGIFHLATTAGDVVTAVLEPGTLVAIVVYAILAWGIAQLVTILSGKLQE